MKHLGVIAISVIATLIFSCDSTNTSFEKAVPDVYVLHIISIPGEGGTVSPDSGAYIRATKIELRAIANPGWVFDGWQGDLESQNNPDSLMVDNNKYILARFIQNEFDLDIQIDGKGKITTEVITNKSLTSNISINSLFSSLLKQKPQNISNSTEAVDSASQPSYKPSQIIKLTAKADKKWFFVQWQGDLTGNENPVNLIMDSDKKITALFRRIKKCKSSN